MKTAGEGSGTGQFYDNLPLHIQEVVDAETDELMQGLSHLRQRDEILTIARSAQRDVLARQVTQYVNVFRKLREGSGVTNDALNSPTQVSPTN